MSITQYATYELQPRNLNAAEISNPYLVLQELFSYGHLPQLREQLVHWFKTTVTSSFNKKLSNSERGDIITMYEWMEKLIEAVHVIHVSRGGFAKSAACKEQQLQLSASVEENMLALIKLTVQPESIFRFTANGSGSPVFLLIVLSNKTTIPFKQAEALLELACINEQHYTCSVIQSAELHQKLSDGHLFYTSVCTYANRIHDDHAPALPQLPPQKIQDIQNNAMQQLEQACSRAAAFSTGANNYVQKGQLPMAAFMLQQAAEQLLRAAIMILLQQEVKTHAISTLLRHTRCCAPQLDEIFAAGENRQLVALLDKTYTEARYGNLVISIAEVNALQLLVAALFHETEESLGRVIGDLGTRE